MMTIKQTLVRVVILALAIVVVNNLAAQPLPQEVVECQDFFGSIDQGKIEQVKKCLEKKPEYIENKNERGSTPVMVAAHRGHAELVHYLIEAGANIHADNGFGTTPLHFAAIGGDLKTAKVLIKHGAQVNAKTQRGTMPMNFAAQSGNLELLKLFESQGADIMELGGNQSSLILWAALGGNVDLFKYLESQNLDIKAVDKDGDGVLHWAGSGSSVEMCKYLVEERGFDIKEKNFTGKYPVEVAIRFGQLETTKYFIEKGIKVNQSNASGGNFLHTVSQSRSLALAKYLIEQGVNVNGIDQDGATPLNEAALHGNVEMVKLLVENGAKVNPKDCFGGNCNKVEGSPLHNAVWDSPAVIKYLVEKGAKLDAKNEKGQTPLHLAAGSRSFDCFKALVDLGADINTQDNSGKTPLHMAIKRNKTEAFDFLLKKGAKINVADKSGKTPLHYAAIAGQLSFAEKLLNNKANVNAKDFENNTPKYFASYYGNQNIIKLLMKNGATNEVFDVENYFAKNVPKGEAVVWYLNHSGWAVKTANNILIFDYWQMDKNEDKACINNGYICSKQLENEKVTVFASHTHRDHYSPEIFDWKDNIKDITYVLGFEEETKVSYTYIAPRETKKVNGIKITPIESTDSGEGFMVEVDGVVIYHPGDHANGNRNDATDHNEEIDFLASKYPKIDLAFFPSSGCRFPDKIALKQGVVYASNKLQPQVAFPMHATTNEDVAYPKFAKEVEEETQGVKFVSVHNKGDRYYYAAPKSSMR